MLPLLILLPWVPGFDFTSVILRTPYKSIIMDLMEEMMQCKSESMEGQIRSNSTTGAGPAVIRTAPTLSHVRHLKPDIVKICDAHGASRIRLFGSVVKGTATSGSDVDFLIDFPQDKTFIDLGLLLDELEVLIGYPVELYTESTLPPDVRQRVLLYCVDL